MSAIQEVSDASFDADVLNASGPVLVDFWAPWCAPCRAVAPVLEEVAQENGEKLKIVKLNVDNNPEVATKFSIRSIPTLLVFKEGSVVDQVIGLVSKDQLQQTLSPHMASS